MNKLEIAFLSNMWNVILLRFRKVSAALQAIDLDLCNAAGLVWSLRDFVAGLRDQFDRFEAAASKMFPTVSDVYKADTERIKIRKRQADESSAPDCHLPGRHKFLVIIYNVVIDRLVVELDRKFQAYNSTVESFGFLNTLQTTSSHGLRVSASRLQEKYAIDLEEDFVEEAIQFQQYVQRDMTMSTSVGELLKLIRKRGLQTVFPNIDIALRLYLTLPVTNASGERSFSKLALIKSKLRSTMQQDRLSHLTLMSIEYDILRAVDFNETTNEFAVRKTRRKTF